MVNNVQVGRNWSVYFHPSANAPVSRLWASGDKIGYVDSASYSIDEGTESYFGAGQRWPYGIVPGPMDITVTLDGLWIDSGAQQFFLNQAEISGALTPFWVGVSGTDRALAFSGCQIASLDGDIPAEGWTTLSVELKSKGIL